MQAGESGLTLLSPFSHTAKPDMEAAAAEPQEDGACCHHPLCLGGAFGRLAFQGNALIKKALAKSSLLAFTSGLLFKKFLMMGSLLALMGGTLVKELLTTSGLLPLTSSFLVEKAFRGRRLEAMALVLPQFIDCPLPILVGSFCLGASPMMNWPPGRFRRQQPSGLLVFAKCLLKAYLTVKGTVCLIIFKHPVGGAWGRLGPFVWQPP